MLFVVNSIMRELTLGLELVPVALHGQTHEWAHLQYENLSQAVHESLHFCKRYNLHFWMDAHHSKSDLVVGKQDDTDLSVDIGKSDG